MKSNLLLLLIYLSFCFDIAAFQYKGQTYHNFLLQMIIPAKTGSTIEFLGQNWKVQEESKKIDPTNDDIFLERTIILKPLSGDPKGLKIEFSTPAKYRVEEVELPQTSFLQNIMATVLIGTGIAALARYIYLNTYAK